MFQLSIFFSISFNFSLKVSCEDSNSISVFILLCVSVSILYLSFSSLFLKGDFVVLYLLSKNHYNKTA